MEKSVEEHVWIPTQDVVTWTVEDKVETIAAVAPARQVATPIAEMFVSSAG